MERLFVLLSLVMVVNIQASEPKKESIRERVARME